MSYEAVDWVAHHANYTPNKVAQIDLASGRRFTYAQMHERVGRLAAHLDSLGVGPGDRVGFLAFNSTDILDIIFATWRVGGVALALNFRLTATEHAFIVGDATPKVMFIDDELAAVGTELRGLTDVPHWIGFDGRGGDSALERAIDAALGMITQMVPRLMTDQCLLMYSSGTTGKPKGVIITHGMLQFAAQNGIGPGNVSAHGVALASMPMFHIGALNVSCMPTVVIGATNVVMRVFEPAAVLAAISDADLGITHVFAVPAALNVLRQTPGAEDADFSRIITMIAGAETVPPPLVEWWRARGVIVQEGYGLTETAGSGCLLLKEEVAAKVGSAGKAMMHSRFKIIRSDGTDAPANEPGEICMKGAVITPGYWNRPEATAKAFTGDGWFKTGDIGRIDAEGYIFIEDRVKDMYISGGENVYPAEIEGILYGLDAIAEVAVIGVKDDKWGETGCAVVALKPGATLTLAEVASCCEGALAAYKHPRHLHLVEALPRNATGKVLKFKLRETVPGALGQ